MAFSYKELASKSDEELVAEHDKLAQSTQPGINYYLDELRRRDSDRTNARVEDLTEKVAAMTRRIEFLTWAAVACGVISILIALSK